MRILILIVLCSAAAFISGCAAGIKRTGYSLPPNKTSKDFERCPITIRNNWEYDTNEVVILGSIRDHDTGFSTECDEAYVLDIFSREGCMMGADIINITKERQPNIWTSTCYRASADFLRFKDRNKARGLLSDAKYAPDLIVERSVKSNKRTQNAIIGTVAGGPLVGIIVWSATGSTSRPSTNSVPVRP